MAFWSRATEKPPAPDTSRVPVIAGQTVVEVMYSPSQHVRGIVTVDGAGLFRVRTEVWDTSDWDVVRSAFWSLERSAIFTDTIEQARSLCQEAMIASVAYLPPVSGGPSDGHE